MSMWERDGDIFRHKVYPEWEIHNARDGVLFHLRNANTGEIVAPASDLELHEVFVMHIADKWLEIYQDI